MAGKQFPHMLELAAYFLAQVPVVSPAGMGCKPSQRRFVMLAPVTRVLPLQRKLSQPFERIAMPALFRLLTLLLLLPFAAHAQDKSAAEISVQLGHGGAVNAVAFTPNGRVLVSGGGLDVKLWDIASGRELRPLPQPGKAVHSIAVSPDENIIASGNSNGAVTLWDAASGRELRTLKVYGSWVRSLAFSPDGRTLASACDNDARLWDVASGRELRKLSGHKRQINSLAFSPDGRMLATGADDMLVKLWDTATGHELRTLAPQGKYNYVWAVAFSPDGRTLATADDYAIIFWDAESGRELRVIREKSGGRAIAFSRDGKTLAAGGIIHPLQFWDVASGQPAGGRKPPGEGNIRSTHSIAYSPDGRTLSTGHNDRPIRLWDAASGAELRSFRGHGLRVNDAAYAPDGRTVASASEDGSIRVWELATGQVKQTLKGHAKGTNALAYASDGHILASGGEDYLVRLWDTASGRELQRLSGHKHLVSAVAFSRDGKIIASGSLDETIKLWDADTGRELRTLSGHSKNVSGVAFSPDGRTLASVSHDKSLRLWDVASGRALRVVDDNVLYLYAVAFSPDGRTLAVGGLDFRLWDAASGRKLFQDFDGGGTGSVAFSPDGQTVISTNGSNIRFREAASGKLLRMFTAHGGAASAVFSPDGRKLVSVGSDTTTRLWDVASGEQKASFVAFNDGSTITITPEGYYDASSEKAEENINVRLGNQVFGIGAYREKFYRPDLVKLALSGGSLSQMARLDKVKPAPRVELLEVPASPSKPQLQVKLRLTDSGGGIGDVRLFLNGAAVVQQASRTLSVQKAGGEGTVQTYTLRLVNGVNKIKAVAFNAQNSMQSNPALAELEASLPKARPSLYGVVVGIQEFKNPRFKLNFAIADARLFADTLRQNVGALFQTVDIKLLTTPQETTRASLIQTLQGMRQKVGPEDLFVFFVASHGTAEEGEYFLITSNVGSISTDRLKADALSQADLKELMANIPATKKLIVIDTCNAGALGDTLQAAFLTRGMSDATAMKILARSVGSTVLSASTSSQEALEGYKKHGLFTYVLAEGLMGKADLDKDGFVSTLELAAYVDAQVPVIAEKVFNHPQYPVVSPSGQGFPLVKVK